MKSSLASALVLVMAISLTVAHTRSAQAEDDSLSFAAHNWFAFQLARRAIERPVFGRPAIGTWSTPPSRGPQTPVVNVSVTRPPVRLVRPRVQTVVVPMNTGTVTDHGLSTALPSWVIASRTCGALNGPTTGIMSGVAEY